MLVLTYHSDTTIPVEAESLTTDTLRGKSDDAISREAFYRTDDE